MDTKILIYALGIWFLFMIFFIMNGTLRNYVYAPVIGEWEGHVVSSFIGIGFILLVTYISLKFLLTGYSNMDLIMLGLFWFSLTVAFEFIFGHFIAGHSWEKLLADYNIMKGRIWSLVLLTTLTAPYIIGRILKT